MPETPAERLAHFVSELEPTAVPDTAMQTAARCFVDTLGVLLAGTKEGAGPLTIRSVRKRSGGGPSPLAGTDAYASPTDAAFANATAAHSLDFDDYTVAVPGHTSAVLVPALLALCSSEKALGRSVSGKEALCAYVAGFETMNFVGAAIRPSHYDAGWHATSTLGVFGAAAAGASALRLGTEQTQHALCAAASAAAGVRRNFGSGTKPIHAGTAARGGLSAALSAAAGVTAASDALSGEYGFFDLYAGTTTPDIDSLPELGSPFALVDDGVIFKKYACCGAAHTSVAAAEALVEDGLVASDVARATLSGPKRLEDILRYDVPSTPEEAKFSTRYPVARALAGESGGLSGYTRDALDDELVLDLCHKVRFEVDETRPYHDSGVTVHVELSSGESVTASQSARPGSPVDPISVSELRQKFIECTAETLGDRAPSAFDSVLTIEDAADVSDVVDPLLSTQTP
ncbi:MmgE/PrpD family protein [Haloferax sp. MBLA0076]|uniref:MmgE/PrpD family protein n=1 Tax=Haloferax litoreum TaxID=2666140 RepID=A0A6A8GJP3_9EURY|nr:MULTISPECIES: MmgE/PrpD family protein [Haloferax]KAB1190438.1 MmgE/PrpD family protein [Haloferax sp. CBA1148]MRX23413.1 MmgE/PrpD family protein [Haloferax litoreum]